VRAVGDDHLVVAVDRLDAARESQIAGSSVTDLLQWYELEESTERRQFLAQLGALNPWMITERGWAGREFRAGRKVILPSGYAVSAAGKQHLTDYLIAQHEANRSYGAKVGAAVRERVSEGAVMGLAWLAVTLGADPAGWADDAITIAGELGRLLDERSLRQAAVMAGYTAAAVLPAASTRAVKAVEQAVDKALDAARRTATDAARHLSPDALQQIATAADDIIKRLEKAPNRGPNLARQLGREGEDSAGIVQSAKQRIPSVTRTGHYRIPDELTEVTLREIKNVIKLSNTSQLRDFLAHAQATGRTFILETRATTKISSPLQELIDRGLIVHRVIGE